MISGGNALVQLSYPEGQRLPLVVKLNGNDVTGAFRAGTTPNTWVGLVKGLQVGNNTLRVMSKLPASDQSFTLVNYPITGPIFSGPHQTPFFCETVTSGLGAPLDANCSANTIYTYYYRNTAGQFVVLPSTTQYPANLRFTTVNGVQVPYIMRVESGTLNRAIYRIVVLDDPVAPQTTPWRPGAGWNGKLAYFFDGGCGGGKQQGNNQPSLAFDNVPLDLGYAVVTTTFNAYRVGCDDVLSAETAMMMKEYFSERYGIPKYTMGRGGSGGAMQQQLIANNYPGILDGIIPERSFPDGQTLVNNATDSFALNDYFNNKAAAPWPNTQRVAVAGYGVIGSLNSWAPKTAGRATIFSTVCANVIPVAARYNAITNPTGVRCSMFDSMGTYYGKDPVTGFAWRAIDTVGVQYGLNALNAGLISVDQFLDLNAKIGGYDIDGNSIPTRTIGQPLGIAAGFKTGRVNDGSNMHLPIIDLRQYNDGGNGDVHTRFHTLEMRQRMLNSKGSAANQALLLTASVNDARTAFAIGMMDQWLEALLADHSSDSYATKVLRARPAALIDGCWHPTSGVFIPEPTPFDKNSACNQLFPYFGNPRTAAGGTITEDIVKCELMPISMSDYAVTFTPAQATTLAQIFSTGVCDYSKKSVYREAWDGPWQSWGPAQ